MKNLNPQLLNKPYDPNNVYSVPYMWGSSAIGVNAKYVKPSSITSWNDLWNPAFKGKVLLMDDVRDVFAMSLRSLGYSGNDTNPEHIKAAYQKLLKLKPSVKVFNSDSPKQPFLNNEVYIGQIWGGEVYQAGKENPNIVYIYPREGATFWVDSMVIPTSVRNIRERPCLHQFHAQARHRQEKLRVRGLCNGQPQGPGHARRQRPGTTRPSIRTPGTLTRANSSRTWAMPSSSMRSTGRC